MAFSVKELSSSLAANPGENAWMVVIGCDSRSVLAGCTGTPPPRQHAVRLDPIDSAQGLKSAKDLDALKEAMNATLERLSYLEGIPDPKA